VCMGGVYWKVYKKGVPGGVLGVCTRGVYGGCVLGVCP